MVAKYERNGSGLCCNLSSTPVEKLEDYLPPTTFDDLGFWDIEPGALLYDKVLNMPGDVISSRRLSVYIDNLFRKLIFLVLVHLDKSSAQHFKKILI